MEASLLVRLLFGGLFLLGLTAGNVLERLASRFSCETGPFPPQHSCGDLTDQSIPADAASAFGRFFRRDSRRRRAERAAWRRYPVGIAAGFLWAAAGWKAAGRFAGGEDILNCFGMGAVWMLFVSALVVVFLVDWRYGIIPDEISIGGLVLSLVAAAVFPGLHDAAGFADALGVSPRIGGLTAAALGGSAGFVFGCCVYYAGKLLFRRQIETARREDPEVDSVLGRGDVKLLAFLGAFLGWEGVFVVFACAAILGAVAGCGIRLATGDIGGTPGLAGLKKRWLSGDSVLPFGPFLAVAGLIFLFFGEIFP